MDHVFSYPIRRSQTIIKSVRPIKETPSSLSWYYLVNEKTPGPKTKLKLLSPSKVLSLGKRATSFVSFIYHHEMKHNLFSVYCSIYQQKALKDIVSLGHCLPTHISIYVYWQGLQSICTRQNTRGRLQLPRCNHDDECSYSVRVSNILSSFPVRESWDAFRPGGGKRRRWI